MATNLLAQLRKDNPRYAHYDDDQFIDLISSQAGIPRSQLMQRIGGEEQSNTPPTSLPTSSPTSVIDKLRADNPRYRHYSDEQWVSLIAENTNSTFEDAASMLGYQPPDPEPINDSQEERPSGFTGLLGNVVRGAKQAGRSIGAMGNTITGDLAAVEDYARRSQESAEKEMPEEQRQLHSELQAIDREQGAMGQIGDTLGAAARNPMGTAQLITEQIPNSAVSLGSGWAGFKTGAALGAAAGPVGAGIGGTLGFLGGMFLGNYMLEGGSKAIEKAEGGFTEDERRETLTEGAKKAGVITAVDAATFKAGSMIANRLGGAAAVKNGAKAEAEVLMKAGVDMSSPATINAALAKSPELMKQAKIAGERAAINTLSRSKKAGIAGTGLSLETVGEGAGEYLGEMAATGEGDVVDATIEALAGFSQSAVQTVYNYNRLGNKLDPENIRRQAEEINQAKIQEGINNIANAETVDEAIQAAADTAAQKPVTPGDVMDDIAYREELLKRTEDFTQGEANEETQQETITQPVQTAEVLRAQPKTARDTEIMLPDNTNMPAQWDVIDAAQVQATMKEGKNQPRDRTRTASESQIAGIANNPNYALVSDSPVMDVGAPVLDNNGAIVAGNGRFEGLSRAYQLGTATLYKETLMADAARKGIDPAVIAGMERPILVRRITQPIDTRKTAIKSNSGLGLQYSALELAKIDAERMRNLSDIEVSDNGDIVLNAQNIQKLRSALSDYDASELGALVDKDGMLSQEGVRRVKSAILHSAYGDSPTLSRMIESTDNDIRNITGALTKVAGNVAKVRNDIKQGAIPKELDVTNDLIEAVEKLAELKARNQPVDNYLAQQGLFGEHITPESREFIQFLSDNMRSQKKLTEFINSVYDSIGSIDTSTPDIFGDAPIPSKQDVIQHAKQRKDQGQQDGATDSGTAQQSQARSENQRDTQERSGQSKTDERLVPVSKRNKDVGVNENNIDYNDRQSNSSDKINESVEDASTNQRKSSYNPNNLSLDLGTRNLDLDYGEIEQRPGTTEKQREIGNRAFRDLVRSAQRMGGSLLAANIAKDFKEQAGSVLIGRNVETPQDLAVLAQVLRDPRFETFRIFFVKNGRIVHHTGITSRLPGSVDVVIQEKGETAKQAFARFIANINNQMKASEADGYYLLHNHPSGRARASTADIQLTKQIAANLPGFRSHVIIDHNEYGEISVQELDDIQLVDEKVHKVVLTGGYSGESSLPHNVLQSTISNAQELAGIGKHFEQSNEWFTLVGRSANGRVVSIAQMPMSALKKPDLWLLGALRRFARSSGATRLMAVTEDQNLDRFENAVLNGVLLDVTSSDGSTSLRQRMQTARDDGLFGSGKRKAIQVKQDDIPETININGVERPTRNSNGQLIHPTEEGIRNFYRWFGDSKVVDEQGRPLLVYHGTDHQFDSFDSDTNNKTDEGFAGRGFYFTNADYIAEEYGNRLIPSYLSMNNPLVADNYDDIALTAGVSNGRDRTGKASRKISTHLKGKGYDGVFITDKDENGNPVNEYVAYRPSQIKSAAGNQGTFSTSDNNILRSTPAWHGSPHDHDRFSMDKIGSGEGAQAYGYGLYFTDTKEIAEFYKKQSTAGNMSINGKKFVPGTYRINIIVANNINDHNKIASELKKHINESKDNPYASIEDAQKIIDSIEQGTFNTGKPGKLYQVELAPEQDEYLLWDKPLSEQSEKVKKIINSGLEDRLLPLRGEKNNETVLDHNGGMTGEELYKTLSGKHGGYGSDKKASEYLHSIGIRGIKYLDGSSRSKGEGAYNYVIFDDKDVSITNKYSKRKQQTKSLSVEEVKQAVNPLRSRLGNGIRINVVQSTSDIPARVHERSVEDSVPIDTDGVYDPAEKTVYLIADNIPSAERALWVALHETVGHAGLRSLGKDVQQTITYASKNKFVADLGRAIAKDRQQDYDAIHHNEEAIAELSAALLSDNVDAILERYGIVVPENARKNLESIIERVVEAIRRFAAKVMGKVTDNQIRELVMAAKVAVEGGRIESGKAANDYIKESLRLIRNGYRTVNDFIIPETPEYADNITGDLAYVPANDSIPVGPLRVEVGEATGPHQGRGILHIADNARRDSARMPKRETGDLAEDLMRDALALMKGVKTAHHDGDYVFVNPSMRRAIVAKFIRNGDYYSVRTIRPYNTNPELLWGNSEWNGRLTFPFRETTAASPSETDHQDNFAPFPDRSGQEDIFREKFTIPESNEKGQDKKQPTVTTKKRRNIEEPKLSRAQTLANAGVNTTTTQAGKASTTLPEETKFQAFRRKTQDAMLRFKLVQEWLNEQGVNLTEAANVYQRENISKGKTANLIENFRNKELEPLIKDIAEAKFELGDIATYLEARHIPEANARMRQIHNDPNATANGITDQQAQKVLADFQAMPNFKEFEKLAGRVWNIGQETLDMRLNAGLISQEQYDAYKNTYKNWVPLRGNVNPQGFGKGLSTSHKDKRRMGHGFREDEFVLENLVQDRERAIMQVEKNKVSLSVLEFLMQANNPEIGTVGKPQKRATIKDHSYAVEYKGQVVGSFENKGAADSAVLKILNGSSNLQLPGVASILPQDLKVVKTYDPRVVMMARPQLEDNEIQAMINGSSVRMQLNDPLLARAGTAAGIEQVGGILEAARSFNRFLSKAYTSLSPDFFLTNMFRDAYSGTLVLTGKQGGKFTAKVFKNYASSFRDLWKARKDPAKSQWVTRYRNAGGNIGAAWLSDLDRVGQDAMAALQRFAGARQTYNMVYSEQKANGASDKKARTMAILKAGKAKVSSLPVIGNLFEMVERVNAVIENTLRLATFRTAIESGLSDQQAAMLSKDLLNFNRKGEQTSQLGALYLFFNPAAQSAHITAEALFTSPHKKQVWALLSAMTALSFLLSELGRGDDEDEWDKIPEHIKDRNLVFKYGDMQATIPVSYGWGFAHSFGRLVSDFLHGEDASKVAVKLAASFVDNFSPAGNPIDTGDNDTNISAFQLLPTIPKMIVGPSVNMNSFGNEIYPHKYNESMPDSQLASRGVRGTIYQDLADFLNDTTGGSKYEPGVVSISPNTIKYWVTSLAGGAGRFVSDIFTGAMDAASGVAPELENVPVARRFVRESGVKDSRAAFWKAKKEAQAAAERFNRAVKDGEIYYAQESFDKHGDLIALAKFADANAKMAAYYRDAVLGIQLDKDMSKTEQRARIKELEMQEKVVYDEFLSVFRDVKK